MNKKYFHVAGMTIEVRSDLPFNKNTFASKFDAFETSGPLEENIVLHHHFSSSLPLLELECSDKLYFRPPWAIYQQDEQWIYQRIKPKPPHKNYYQTIVTNKEHSHLDIYNDDTIKQKFLDGNLTSLTMFPTDQILTGRLLAYKKGCIMHSLGIILDGRGYLFVGHSDAGKSTMAGMMKKNGAQVLCDDRNIIRKKNDIYTLSGTWSHGDVTDVSSKTAPLVGIFFLNQSAENRLEPVQDETTVFESLLACMIRPLETRDWWEKSLDFLTLAAGEISCWNLKFNKDGKVFNLIEGMSHE